MARKRDLRVGDERARRFGATVAIDLLDGDGTATARRRASNTVVRGGATLIAGLFRGDAGAGRITHMSVGADPNPEVPPFATTELAAKHADTGELTGVRDVPLTASDFKVAVDEEERRVVVSGRFVLGAGTGALAGTVAEAALVHVAGDGTRRLYNRVTFEPIDKRADQELALYWEVFFPYGDPG